MDTVKTASILYTTGYFITSNVEALMTVAKYACESNTPLGFNLSATFLIEFSTKAVNDALEYADYVFCNEDEGACYAKTNGVEYTNLLEVASSIALSKKANT